jgi:hypothetical protein
LALQGESAIEYDERVLERTAEGQVRKTLRICRGMDFKRTIGDRPQANSLRAEVHRLVLLRHQHTEVPFSPDGPLTWGEIDLVRTDVFTPALAGLLPDRPVREGDRWLAVTSAVQELTDLEKIEGGSLECRLDRVQLQDNRPQARVTFTGTVRGTNEDGPNRQHLQGYFLFDLDSNHLGYLYLKGRHSLLDPDGKEVGRVEGRFVLSRQVNVQPRELSDEALRGVAVEPNADNTLLLYDNPDLGLRFLYPRRWRVAAVARGNQVTLDGADGSGLLLTVEPPAQVPTGNQFLGESRAWLQSQKARVLQVTLPAAVPPRGGEAPPSVLEHFTVEAEIKGQRVFLDYYVSRQAAGGVTLAARLLPADLAGLRKEVERLAQSLVVSKKN